MSTRLRQMDREFQVLIDETLSPEAQSEIFGREARKLIEEQDAVNDRLAGRDVQYETFVDGRPSIDLESAESVIAAEWDVFDTVLMDIYDMLVVKSPILTGAFRQSITLFADGIPVPVTETSPNADEYFFAATVPYARKIEKGLSPQAPDGVFEAVATIARRRFSNIATIRYGFRSVVEQQEFRASPGNRASRVTERSNRVPAIVVRLR